MNRNKRYAQLLWIMLLIAAIGLSGCGTNNNESNAAASNKSDSNDTANNGTTGEDQSPKPVKLDLFVNLSWANYPEWGSNEVSKAIREKTGVDLTFQKPTTDDNQQFNLMLASGEFPDFVVNDTQNPTYEKAVQAGVYEDLGALMEQYAPELRERMGEDYWKMNQSPDGKNYSFINAEMRPSNLDKFLPVGPWNPATLIRQDIYDALGKPKLDTPEDLLNVLKTVKEKYPDIAPMIIGNTKFDFDAAPGGYQYLFAQFGIEKYYEKDDQLFATYKDPNYLTALKWMNSLYRSGIISRSDLALTDEQRKATIDSGNMFFYAGQVSNGFYIPPNNKELSFFYAPMFPNATILQQGSIGWTGWSIAKSSKHKEEAIKFMAYMLSDEGQKLSTFGFENKDWQMENDTPVRTEEFLANNKNDPEYAAKIGYGAYWFNLDLYDHWITGGEMQKNPEQKQALDLYLPHKNLKFYMLNLLPAPDLEEAAILQKIKTAYNAAFPTFLMAKDEAEVEKLYNEFVEKSEAAGMAKVEKVWNANSIKMKSVFK